MQICFGWSQHTKNPSYNFDESANLIYLYKLFESFASTLSGFIDTYEVCNAVADVKELNELFKIKLLTLYVVLIVCSHWIVTPSSHWGPCVNCIISKLIANYFSLLTFEIIHKRDYKMFSVNQFLVQNSLKYPGQLMLSTNWLIIWIVVHDYWLYVLHLF